MHDYLKRFSSLSSEDALFDIPLRKEFLLSEIGRKKRVLDVGCLGGRITRMIVERDNEVWGIELNPEAAEVAKSRGIRVKVANVEEGLPFEDRGFDVVNAGELMEHLYDTKAFFSEVNRVLKPGGAFLFSTPNLNSIENRVRVLAGGYLSMTGAYPEDHFGENVRVFNLAKIRELCGLTGFRLDKVRGISRLGSRRRWVRFHLGLASRLLPSFSKLLMVKAVKEG